MAQNEFYNLVTVDVVVGEVIEISSEVCFELEDTFTGMDPLLYIIFKDTATSTEDNVSATTFTDSNAASLTVKCGTVSYRSSITEDGTIEVWVRGNKVEDGNVTLKSRFSNVGYKIWVPGYTTPNDNE